MKAFVRNAAIEDAESLALVQIDSYRSAYAGMLPDDYLAQFSYDEQEQDWRELLSSGEIDVLLVAKNEAGEVVGYALGERLDGQSYDCELVALHVRQADQGRGIGRGLIAALAEQFRQQGCRSLVLWVLDANQYARSLYERLGGQAVGRRHLELDENTALDEVAYAWPDIMLLAG